ncbi:MAG TPA: type II toxin-antitoxin system PemK/MazF family toxin [Nocardioides sp.]
MRPIHLVHLDKTRSALVLTRDLARGAMNNVTVAPITSTVKGLSTEVAIGSQQGVDDRSVISCDNIHTVPVTRLGRVVGFLPDSLEPALAEAIVNAFDLHVEDIA